MHDEVKLELVAALDAEAKVLSPDLAWVVARGSRIRALRMVATTATIALLLAAGVGSARLLTAREVGAPPLPVASHSAPERDHGRPVIEEMTTEEEAEVFAYRALALTEVMDPLGERTYTWTYEDDTTRADRSWRVGFASADCAPDVTGDGFSQTCTPFGGEDPQTGNPVGADTFVEVTRDGDVWRVTGVEGNMPEDQRARVVGFELPRRSEPSHWDLRAASVWSEEAGQMVAASPVWVGPYPTEAPGSVCELRAYDAKGRPAFTQTYYLEPPSRETDRAGWVRGTDAEPATGLVDVTVSCRQYTGAGWEVESDAELIGEPGVALGATATLVWRGDEGFTASARCRATLVDEAGGTVWEGSGRVEPLGRPSELADYPYRTEALVTTRGEAVPAHHVGEFVCETR